MAEGARSAVATRPGAGARATENPAMRVLVATRRAQCASVDAHRRNLARTDMLARNSRDASRARRPLRAAARPPRSACCAPTGGAGRGGAGQRGAGLAT
jgi:hypothetical protein